MTGDKDRSGTMLVEPRTTEVEITLPEVAPRETRRSYGPLLAFVAVAAVLLAMWALVWRPAADEGVQQPVGSISTHDSGIQAQLRALAPSGDIGTQHDSGIAAQLRQRSTVSSQHDSGIVAQLRERNTVSSQHDSGIVAQLNARAGGTCGPAPGAGGWEARLTSAC
jgi:hypothetical protein